MPYRLERFVDGAWTTYGWYSDSEPDPTLSDLDVDSWDGFRGVAYPSDDRREYLQWNSPDGWDTEPHSGRKVGEYSAGVTENFRVVSTGWSEFSDLQP